MKKKRLLPAVLLSTGIMISSFTMAQYNSNAGRNVVTEHVEEINDVEEVYFDTNTQSEKRRIVRQTRIVEKEVKADAFGNAEGTQYDLAVDGAFEGQTIAVLHLYTGEGFDFELPRQALKEKGFSVYRWMNRPPSAEELEKALKKSCQLWIISSSSQMLTEAHIKVIKDFFDRGKGVYIWGDNSPYYADANSVAKALIGVEMTGNTMGNKVVGLMTEGKKAGVMPNHLITTGLQYVYEGITIATLSDNEALTPLIYGSAENLVTAAYENDGKRLILDGGFTRLFINWDTAGTGRYVKNAAAWLVNYERFGDEVLAENVTEKKDPDAEK